MDKLKKILFVFLITISWRGSYAMGGDITTQSEKTVTLTFIAPAATTSGPPQSCEGLTGRQLECCQQQLPPDQCNTGGNTTTSGPPQSCEGLTGRELECCQQQLPPDQCNAGGNTTTTTTVPVGGECPPDYPVDCGTGCCPSEFPICGSGAYDGKCCKYPPCDGSDTTTTTPDGPCPARMVLGHDSSDIAKLHAFRDVILTNTGERGNYTSLYYKHALELSYIFAHNQELREKANNLIKKIMPAITCLLTKKNAMLSEYTIQESIMLIDALKTHANPALEKALFNLEQDIKNRSIFKMYKINIRRD
jgi:hypothetical protein